jgi:hypothetical protein
MGRIQVIHWNKDEAKERSERLSGLGHKVVWKLSSGPDLLRKLKDDPAVAIVIDLSRLPSHGREIGIALRHQHATRFIPLVFVEGDPEKVAIIKGLLPDAVYTTWGRVRSAVKRAIAHPPTNPFVPESVFAAYEGRPLVTKLGIKAASTVALLGAPRGFRKLLDPLPDGVQFRASLGACDLAVWFVRLLRDLEKSIKRTASQAAGSPLWIAWPKQTSPLAADLTEKSVRRIGLDAGLVDYKVCSIDSTWSGLLFKKRAKKGAVK